MNTLRTVGVFLALSAASLTIAAQSAQEYETYLAKIAAAEALIRIDEIGEAKMHLATAPAPYRGWEWDYLRRLSDNSEFTLEADREGAYALAVSPDGKIIATGGNDKAVKLWDAGTRSLIGELEGHTGTVTTLDFSPDGKLLASGSTDKTIKIWDTANRSLRSTITDGLSQKIYEVDFHPDGTRIAAASWDFTREPFKVFGWAKVFEVTTGKLLYRVEGTAHPASTVRFSNDGEQLAVGDWGALVQIVASDTGKVLMKRDLHESAVYRAVDSVAFSGDGKRIVSVGKDKIVRILNAGDGSTLFEIDGFQGHRKKINSTVFSADGRTYATGSSDTLIKIWDGSTNAHLRTLRGHTKEVTRIAFSPDGETLYSVAADGDLKIWRAAPESASSFDVCDNGPWSAPVSVNDGHFVAACSDTRIGVWGLNGVAKRVFDGVAANYASFTPEGDPVTVGHDSRVVVWDLAKATVKREFKPHDASLYGVDVSTKGLIAAGGDNRTAVVYGAEGEIKRITYEEGNPHYVKFTPDGNHLILGLTNGTVDIVSVGDWESIAKLKAPERVMNLNVSDDGKMLLVGAEKGTVTLWDLQSFRLLHTLNGHDAAVFALSFHPDGSRIATGGYDQTVRIWDTGTGRQVMTLRDFETNVYTVSFFNKGKGLLASQTDGVVKIF